MRERERERKYKKIKQKRTKRNPDMTASFENAHKERMSFFGGFSYWGEKARRVSTKRSLCRKNCLRIWEGRERKKNKKDVAP